MTVFHQKYEIFSENKKFLYINLIDIFKINGEHLRSTYLTLRKIPLIQNYTVEDIN